MSSRRSNEKKSRRQRYSTDSYKIRIEPVKLYPALKNKAYGRVYGYINDKGILILEAKYQEAYDFNEFGIALVVENNLTGAINAQGEYVIKPIYDSINPYKEGRAIYALNGSLGVMDENRTTITKKTYDFISDYNDERAIIGVSNTDSSYDYAYIDKDGNEVIPPKFLQANEFKDGVALVKTKVKEYALIDKDGNILNTYNFEFVSQYGDGVMVFAHSLNEHFGYINKEGLEIIKPIYTIANGFKDGIAVVSTDDSYNSNYGAIALNGKYIFEPIYSEIKPLGEGRVALGMALGDDKGVKTSIYAIGDTTGRKLTNFRYLAVSNYEGGLASASDKLNTFFINKNGHLDRNLPVERGSGELIFKNNIILANLDFSPYYLNKSGKVIYKPNDTIVLSDHYSVKKVKYKPNINYLIYNPEVSGVTKKSVEIEINSKLKQLSYFNPYAKEGNTYPTAITPDSILNFNYYGDFSVLFFKNNVLVLDMTGYYYAYGAAHGMPSKKTPIIDLITGQFYNLGDLFTKSVNWISELNKIIENMINTDPQYEYIFKDAFKKIEEGQSFYIDDNNLYIYFKPYEVGPYAAGFVTFKIPFEEIEGMLNKQDRFYKAFNSLQKVENMNNYNYIHSYFKKYFA